MLLEDDSVAHYRMEGVPIDIKLLGKSLVQCSGGMIDTDGNFSSGVHFQEVGIACEITPFQGGGKVINFGSIGFYNAVSGPDSIGERIFINSVSYLLNPHVIESSENPTPEESEDNIPLYLERKDDFVEFSPKEKGFCHRCNKI